MFIRLSPYAVFVILQLKTTTSYRKVPKVTTPRKWQTSESSDKMSQVLANPESSDPPENNDPSKVETSKLISLFAKNDGYGGYPEQILIY